MALSWYGSGLFLIVSCLIRRWKWPYPSKDPVSGLSYLALAWLRHPGRVERLASLQHWSRLIPVLPGLIPRWKWPHLDCILLNPHMEVALSSHSSCLRLLISGLLLIETSRQLSYLYVHVTFFMRCTGQPQKVPALTYMWKWPYNAMDLAPSL